MTMTTTTDQNNKTPETLIPDPKMDTIIQTPRLILIRLTDPSDDSQHLKWFHEHWSDPEMTTWSIHGPCKSLQESQSFMIEQLEKFGSIKYSVFLRPDASKTTTTTTPAPDLNGSNNVTTTSDGILQHLGPHIGMTGLRAPPTGTIVPPLPYTPSPSSSSSSSSSNPTTTGTTTTTTTETTKDAAPEKPLNPRTLGYAFSKSYWGAGYATEANAALLQTYTAYCAREKSEYRNYIEAGVDEGNPGSTNVVRKLGFVKAGFKVEEVPVFLGGDWRTGGYWVFGLYV